MLGPFTVKPFPEAFKFVRVTFQERVFFTTTGRVALPPTATPPNDRLAGEAVRTGVFTPLPETASLRFVFVALLVKVRPLPIQPASVGEKTTFTLTL